MGLQAWKRAAALPTPSSAPRGLNPQVLCVERPGWVPGPAFSPDRARVTDCLCPGTHPGMLRGVCRLWRRPRDLVPGTLAPSVSLKFLGVAGT